MKNVLLLFAVFISFNSLCQDKFNALSGYLRVTKDNVYQMSWQINKDKQITDMAYLNFTNKADAIEFVNDYTDCVENIKTIEKPLYTIISTKEHLTLFNSDEQIQQSVKKDLKNGLATMEEALDYME